MNAVLIDTNVLVYRQDISESEKRLRAREVLDALGARGVLTTQVLGEYATVSLRKFGHRAGLEDVSRGVGMMAHVFRVCPVTAAAVLDALRGMQEHAMSYWDALIWATALHNRVPVVLTEDFSHGRVVEGVRYVNPFRPDFEMTELG